MNKKIISQLIIHGKTVVSEKILLKSVKLIQKSIVKNHRKLIKIALVNITSLVKVKQLKRKRFQFKEFPFIINKNTRIPMALKFMFKNFDSKTEIKIEKRVVNELLQASKNIGTSINKRKNLYEYSFVKRKFSHYRWF